MKQSVSCYPCIIWQQVTNKHSKNQMLIASQLYFKGPLYTQGKGFTGELFTKYIE